MKPGCHFPAPTGARAAGCVVAALLAAGPAHASFLEGDALARVANIIALVVIIVVPIIVIVLFWMVHVLPEKIAHKRHHPQRDAIHALCLLSLVFGGLLWPLAWLWVYTKPVLYKLAYGRDKHDDYYADTVETDGAAGDELREDVARLRARLEALAAQGGASAELGELRDRLAALEPRLAGKAEAGR